MVVSGLNMDPPIRLKFFEICCRHFTLRLRKVGDLNSITRGFTAQ